MALKLGRQPGVLGSVAPAGPDSVSVEVTCELDNEINVSVIVCAGAGGDLYELVCKAHVPAENVQSQDVKEWSR